MPSLAPAYARSLSRTRTPQKQEKRWGLVVVAYVLERLPVQMIAKALREFIRVSQGKIVVGISAFEGQEDAGIVHSPEVDAPRLPIVKQTREWWTQMFEDVGLHPDRDMWQSFNQSLESLGPDWKTRQGASGEWFALQFVGGALAQVTAPGAGERSSGDTPLTMKYDALGLYADTSPITEAAPASCVIAIGRP